MIEQKIVYEEYYPGMKQIVYAPKPYYPETVKKDFYSVKIVFSKTENKFVYMFFSNLKELLDEMKKKKLLENISLITVMPSHSKGIYSATLVPVAEKISKELKIPFKKVIERIKFSDKKSTDIPSLDKRYLFEKDSMKINDANEIKGKKILLIDDVKTTGMSILEATKILTEAGAKDVVAVCFGINTTSDIAV